MRMTMALAGLLAAAPTIALSQQAPICERQGSTVCGPAKSAWLGATIGNVVIMSQSAVVSAVDARALGTGLVENDRVIARSGAAVIDLGPECLVDVGKGFSALVYRTDPTRICVSVSELTPPAPQQVAPQASPQIAAPVAAPAAAFPVAPVLYGVGALGVAGGIAAVALGKGKGSPAPVSGQ